MRESMARVGPTSMRERLSRLEQAEHGTSQTSIRHHPRLRSAMRQYAVAPIHTSGVAMRHVGPRHATGVPPSVLTWNDAGAAQQRTKGILGPHALGDHLAAAVDQLTPGPDLQRGHM